MASGEQVRVTMGTPDIMGLPPMYGLFGSYEFDTSKNEIKIIDNLSLRTKLGGAGAAGIGINTKFDSITNSIIYSGILDARDTIGGYYSFQASHTLEVNDPYNDASNPNNFIVGYVCEAFMNTCVPNPINSQMLTLSNFNVTEISPIPEVKTSALILLGLFIIFFQLTVRKSINSNFHYYYKFLTNINSKHGYKIYRY